MLALPERPAQDSERRRQEYLAEYAALKAELLRDGALAGAVRARAGGRRSVYDKCSSQKSAGVRRKARSKSSKCFQQNEHSESDLLRGIVQRCALTCKMIENSRWWIPKALLKYSIPLVELSPSPHTHTHPTTHTTGSGNNPRAPPGRSARSRPAPAAFRRGPSASAAARASRTSQWRVRSCASNVSHHKEKQN